MNRRSRFDADRVNINRLDQGLLFCHSEWDDGGRLFRMLVWYDGGTFNGCHQPRTIVEIIESRDESMPRIAVENAWPGIVYRQIRKYPNE